MSSAGAAGAAGAAAASAAAAAAQAAQACGLITRVSPDLFLSIVSRGERPLVVMAAMSGGLFRANWCEHLTSYKGIGFCAKSPLPLQFGAQVEVIQVEKLFIPYV